ncbi:MAG: GNAT family N-acetyltransferase [Alphaproteobacteria bacterium]
MKVTTQTVLTARARGGAIEMCHPRWAEFETWTHLRRANEDYLTPWEPEWSAAQFTRGSYKARLSGFKKMVDADTGYPFHIFRGSDKALIGACNIIGVRRHVAQTAQIGYWLGEQYSGNGFARAAVREASKFCFESLGLHRLEAAVQPENERSIRLLEAVGFTKEGTARGYLKINGVWADHDMYALLSSDG